MSDELSKNKEGESKEISVKTESGSPLELQMSDENILPLSSTEMDDSIKKTLSEEVGIDSGVALDIIGNGAKEDELTEEQKAEIDYQKDLARDPAGSKDEVKEIIEDTDPDPDPRLIVFEKEIATAKFSGDNYEYQKSIAIEWALTLLATKEISIQTEGCPCEGHLTTRIRHNTV